MATTMTRDEMAQLAQTVEMFEVITQTQPFDYQSLEILKEAYSKLGREPDAINTSKRIAHAYVQMGQFSSAILEYETILQYQPDDPEVQAALKQIESKANPVNQPGLTDTAIWKSPDGNTGSFRKPGVTSTPTVDDGRKQMHKIFVDGKILTPEDFDLCWRTPDLATPPTDVNEPFIHLIADKGLIQITAALKLLSDRTRLAFLPLEKYDLDIDLARSFPADTCRRWSVLPFDRMSKSVLVATANPFNQQAAKELATATNSRLLWYLVPPLDLLKNLRKVFR
jgi:tetratricopeptide (TPR) repeat protein